MTIADETLIFLDIAIQIRLSAKLKKYNFQQYEFKFYDLLTDAGSFFFRLSHALLACACSSV